MKLETQLRIFFGEFDTTLTPVTQDALGEPKVPSSRAPTARPARSRWAVAFAAFVALLIGVGGIGLFIDLDRDEPVNASEPPTTPVATTTPVSTTVANTPDSTTEAPRTTSAPVAIQAPLTWRFVDGIDAADAQDSPIEAIAVGGPGFVAVGSQQTPREGGGYAVDAAVWVSADGNDWQRIASPEFGAGIADPSGGRGTQWMSDVAVDRGRIVAVGYEGYAAAVWTSRDGLSWERVTDDGLLPLTDDSSMNAVAVHEGGFVAVGNRGSDAGVWLSSDGVHWMGVTDDDLLGDSDGQVKLWDVETFDGGFLVVGHRGWENPGGVPSYVPFVAISADGRNWDSVPAVEPGGGEGGLAIPVEVSGRNIVMISALVHDGRFFALGLVGAGDALLLTSQDGRSWDAVPLPDLRYPGRLAASGEHLAMIAHYDGQPSVFLTSGDMMEWLAAPVPQMADLRVVLSVGERLLSAGAWHGQDGSEFRTGIWLGTWDE